MNEQAFLEALAKFAPAIQKAFIDAIQDISDSAILDQVTAALEKGDADAAWRALGYRTSVFNGIVAVLRSTFEQGALLMMATLPKYVRDREGIKGALRFDIRDRRAEDWLANQSSSLITKIDADIRTSVRTALTQGLAQGRNPNNVALDIIGRYDRQTGHREGGLIGLGEREQLWTQNTRDKLARLDPSYFQLTLRDKRFDSTVSAAIASDQPLPQQTIDKLVDRYKSNALRFRGETIGRTETLPSLNRSEFESTRQALERAGLPPAAATKEWDSTGDDKVRPEHRELDGQRVPIDQPFVTSQGVRMLHPGDISLGASGNSVIACRCRVKYKVDFGYGVQ